MAVNLLTKTIIQRPADEVAAYVANLDNAPEWYVNIKSAQWETPKPLQTNGPFPMETTYTWEDHGNGQTRMTLRNTGEPSGFSKLFSPFMTSAMRRANEKDLKNPKQWLESS